MLRLLFCVALSVFSWNVFAKNAKDFSKNEDIIKINEHLRGISNAKVKFRQSFGNTTETGTIYYSKNRGLAIKYDTTPVSILVNKSTVTYYDSRLDQKSQIPTKESASEIFTKTLEVSDRDFIIKNVEKIEGAIKITALSKKDKSEGEFTMYFTDKDHTLRRVDITSIDGSQSTRTDLYSHEYGAISPERFKAINIEKEEI